MELQANQRRQNEDEYKSAQKAYEDLSTQRLNNIAKGDNFNPWLALQQGLNETFVLNPAAKALYGNDRVDAATAARDARWEAEKRRAEMAAMTGANPGVFKP